MSVALLPFLACRCFAGSTEMLPGTLASVRQMRVYEDDSPSLNVDSFSVEAYKLKTPLKLCNINLSVYHMLGEQRSALAETAY